MMARFFWYQPRFLYDMVHYKLRARLTCWVPSEW